MPWHQVGQPCSLRNHYNPRSEEDFCRRISRSWGTSFLISCLEIDTNSRTAHSYHGRVPLYWISGAVVYQSIQTPGTVAFRNHIRNHRNRYGGPHDYLHVKLKSIRYRHNTHHRSPFPVPVLRGRYSPSPEDTRPDFQRLVELSCFP